MTVEVNDRTKKLLMRIGSNISVEEALRLSAAVEALKHVKNSDKDVWHKLEELYGTWLNELFTTEEGGPH